MALSRTLIVLAMSAVGCAAGSTAPPDDTGAGPPSGGASATAPPVTNDRAKEDVTPPGCGWVAFTDGFENRPDQNVVGPWDAFLATGSPDPALSLWLDGKFASSGKQSLRVIAAASSAYGRSARLQHDLRVAPGKAPSCVDVSFVLQENAPIAAGAFDVQTLGFMGSMLYVRLEPDVEALAQLELGETVGDEPYAPIRRVAIDRSRPVPVHVVWTPAIDGGKSHVQWSVQGATYDDAASAAHTWATTVRLGVVGTTNDSQADYSIDDFAVR